MRDRVDSSGTPARDSGDAGERFGSDLTLDKLLGGRIELLQPRTGLRATTDSLLLAAAVPAVPGMRVLDVGCGCGTVAFCLGARVSGLALFGLERDPELVALSRSNAARNGIADWNVFAGDLLQLPERLRGKRFEIVCTNPPWQSAASGTASSDLRRRRAMREEKEGLANWLRACGGLVQPGGTLVTVLPANRLDTALDALSECEVERVPLLPRAGRAPTRALVRARVGMSARRRALAGVVLHEGGGYTQAIRRVLWEGEAFPWPEK